MQACPWDRRPREKKGFGFTLDTEQTFLPPMKASIVTIVVLSISTRILPRVQSNKRGRQAQHSTAQHSTAKHSTAQHGAARVHRQHTRTEARDSSMVYISTRTTAMTKRIGRSNVIGWSCFGAATTPPRASCCLHHVRTYERASGSDHRAAALGVSQAHGPRKITGKWARANHRSPMARTRRGREKCFMSLSRLYVCMLGTFLHRNL